MTGASGFAGSRIAQRLLRAGIPVTALYRGNHGLLSESLPGLTWVKGDLSDVPLLADLVADADWVIHAAALVSFAPSDRRELFKVNVQGTADIVNVCLEASVQRFCFVSSVAALGGTGELIDEEAKWDDASRHSDYALSKHLAEREVWRGIAEGLPAFIVNPSVILGKTKPESPLGRLLQIAVASPFCPPGIINLVDADDVAEGIFRLLRHHVTAERFICNAGAISYCSFFKQAAVAADKPAKKREISANMLKLAGTIGGWLRSSFNAATAQAACQTVRYDGGKLARTVNLNYRPIAESIRESVLSLYPSQTHLQRTDGKQKL